MACKLDSYNKALPLTAEDFASVWENFDQDGNGYIEGSELDNFFKELIKLRQEDIQDQAKFKDWVKEMMECHDQNKDGKIEMKELAEILHPDESFLLLFRSQQPKTSIEFMEIWRRFDTDSNGYIDADELKSFVKHLITSSKENNDMAANVEVTPELIDEYSAKILKLFDANKDGKLELKEMAKLLPTKENFLKQFEGKSLTLAEFERVFSHYDKDHNDKIEGDELTGFLRDLIEHEGNEELNMDDINKCSKTLLEICDKNNDGIIQKSELKLLFNPIEDDAPQE